MTLLNDDGSYPSPPATESEHELEVIFRGDFDVMMRLLDQIETNGSGLNYRLENDDDEAVLTLSSIAGRTPDKLQSLLAAHQAAVDLGLVDDVRR